MLLPQAQVSVPFVQLSRSAASFPLRRHAPPREWARSPGGGEWAGKLGGGSQGLGGWARGGEGRDAGAVLGARPEPSERSLAPGSVIPVDVVNH